MRLRGFFEQLFLEDLRSILGSETNLEIEVPISSTPILQHDYLILNGSIYFISRDTATPRRKQRSRNYPSNRSIKEIMK